jgi:hypothetical protein
MDRPPPDPRKLLDEWMEWERGEATPGRVMANLKTGGIRDLLEALAAEAEAMKKASPESSGAAEPSDVGESSAAEVAPASVPTV